MIPPLPREGVAVAEQQDPVASSGCGTWGQPLLVPKEECFSGRQGLLQQDGGEAVQRALYLVALRDPCLF